MPVLEVPKTTLSFQDSLEKLRKAVILTVTVYYNEGMQITNSKGKKTEGVRSRRNQAHVSRRSLSLDLCR